MNRRDFNLATTALACAALAPATARSATARRKIKIGQIGTSHAHASGKLESIRKLSEDYEVVGVVEPDAKRREYCEGREPYDGLKWLSEEQLLSTPGLEAVTMETAVKDLVPTAMRAVTANMHVHVDKPAGESMSELRALHAEASRRKRTVQMGYMLRYNPAFQLCFQVARDGWLGEIFSVDAVMSKVYAAADRKKLMPYPGSAMFELGCHVIDQLVTLMGKPERVTPYPRQVRTDYDTLVDNQMAVFEYPKAAATVRSTLLEIDGGPRRQFIVCGTAGTLQIVPLEPPQVLLTLTEAHSPHKKGRQVVDLPKMTGRYDGEFIDLAAVIRGEKEFAWTPEHDLAVHECILRASGLPLDQ